MLARFVFVVAVTHFLPAAGGSCPEKACHSSNNEDTLDETVVNIPWQLSHLSDVSLGDDLMQSFLNKQINMELQAFYTYLSMAYFFNRDDVALKGFHGMFKKASEEELEHAQKMMSYLNQRGVPIRLGNLTIPCADLLSSVQKSSRSLGDCETVKVRVVNPQKDPEDGLMGCDWRDPLSAVTVARMLEVAVYKNLKLVHQQGEKIRDANIQDFIEDFLDEQIQSIKDLSDLITKLRRVEPCLGYYLVDQELVNAK